MVAFLDTFMPWVAVIAGIILIFMFSLPILAKLFPKLLRRR